MAKSTLNASVAGMSWVRIGVKHTLVHSSSQDMERLSFNTVAFHSNREAQTHRVDVALSALEKLNDEIVEWFDLEHGGN